MTGNRFGVAAIFVLVATLVFVQPVAAQNTPTCGGLAATIVGTPGDDVINGTDGNDVIVGLAGRDIIRGFGGRDTICGGEGRDRLYGGRSSDRLYGGDNGDLLQGEAGADLLFGEQGNDRLIGGNGNDQLIGGPGRRDRLSGRGGVDDCADQQGSTVRDSCETRGPGQPALDVSLPATFGDVSLQPGFEPDPHVTTVISGGAIDVSFLGGECVGFASGAPDLELTYGNGGAYLRMFFQPDGAGDTSLVINDPAGNWLCNDDLDGLNPGIEIPDPLGGTYDIWVASFAPGENVPGVLGVSEFSPMVEDANTAVTVVDQYWSDHWNEFFTGTYQAPEVVGFYDGTRPRNAPVCFNEPLPEFNAVYCPDGHYVAWDVELMAAGYAAGDSWVYLVIAHEWAHAVQELLHPSLVWIDELQADCFAAAALFGAADDGTLIFEEGDSREIAAGLINLADEVPWTDITTHGDAFERVSWFGIGRSGGVNACLP